MKSILHIILIWLGVSFCYSQPQNLKFKHLTTDEGLSQSHINAILKDHQGFMWFGSEDGLNKYDGYKFTHYKQDPYNKNSLSDSNVQDILEDKSGNLWIATSDGLNRFDRNKNSFIRYSSGKLNDNINDIFLDSKGRMWLGTSRGLFLFDVRTGSFKYYLVKGTKSKSIPIYVSQIQEDDQGRLWVGTEHGLYRISFRNGRAISDLDISAVDKRFFSERIKTLFKDHKGNMWIGTDGGGLMVFDEKNKSLRSFLHDPLNNNSLAHNTILSIAQGKDNKVWIGTENGGLSVYDTVLDEFTTYQNNPADNSSISNNSIYRVYADDLGHVWIGTYAGGVNFLPGQAEKFISYRHIVNRENSLSNSTVLSICGDSTGNKVWIGTDGGGLDLFDRQTKVFTHYPHVTGNSNSISNNHVISIIQVSKHVLGLGYPDGGFDFFDTGTGEFTHHMPKENDVASLSSADVIQMVRDTRGNLWIGTWQGGLNFYDTVTKKITHFRSDPKDKTSLSSDLVATVFEDKKKNIWVGTFDGLNLLNADGKHFKRYQNNILDRGSLSSNKVQSIYDSGNGDLWIGTAGGGLNHLDSSSQTFKAYTEKEGLAGNIVHAILKDNKNNLWLSTNQGISKFNLHTRKFKNYGISDGLQGNEFKTNSSFQTADGQMFFGGVNGLSTFYPDSLTENRAIPPVYITGFQIFDKQTAIGERTPIQKDISQAQSVALSYDQSEFTFEFAALNYLHPEKNTYAYKMVGFEKDWNYCGNKRTATYTNLDPGTYFFWVKASNNDGVWNNEGNSIKIIISPPFWLTWWFKTACALAIIGFLAMLDKFRTFGIRKQKKWLEIQVQERTSQLEASIQQEKEAVQQADIANRAKSSFLAAMSHEIRTPMNGVIGLASLLSQTDQTEEQQKFTRSIQTCGHDLLALINDILDFSKIESGNMELEEADFSLIGSIEDVMDLFSARADELQVELIYQIDPDVPAWILGDGHRLRQVIINLLGNAVKFTKQGEVFLKVSLIRDDDQLELGFDVKDTGVGIAEDKMDRLFKAFSQADASTTREYGGTGLGLVICEKLVGLMGGSITVLSRQGEGSTFHFNILARKSAKQTSDFEDYEIHYPENTRILVVDDNQTSGHVLGRQLADLKLAPVITNSAEKALGVLSENNDISLVITDMHMPGLSGEGLAKIIHENYPGLPVMLLSPKGDGVNKNSDLFCAVMSKPVKQQALFQNIVQQLNLNRKILPERVTTPPVPEVLLHPDFSLEYPLSILVAEDNKVNQIVILNALRKLGYSPELAVNGSDAVAQAMQKDFDIIFMDVQMPDMDGLEATRLIKDRNPGRPYITAMTANAQKQDKERCLQAGMDDYISKPFELNELIDLLKKWSLQAQLA